MKKILILSDEILTSIYTDIRAFKMQNPDACDFNIEDVIYALIRGTSSILEPPSSDLGSGKLGEEFLAEMDKKYMKEI